MTCGATTCAPSGRLRNTVVAAAIPERQHQRGGAAFERGDQRLRLVVAGVVGAAVAAAAAVLVVGVADKGRRRSGSAAPPRRSRRRSSRGLARRGWRGGSDGCAASVRPPSACRPMLQWRPPRVALRSCRARHASLAAVPARSSLLLFAAPVRRPLRSCSTFPTAPLTIVTAGGPHKFTVELATDAGADGAGADVPAAASRPMPGCCSTSRRRRWRRCG